MEWKGGERRRWQGTFLEYLCRAFHPLDPGSQAFYFGCDFVHIFQGAGLKPRKATCFPLPSGCVCWSGPAWQ